MEEEDGFFFVCVFLNSVATYLKESNSLFHVSMSNGKNLEQELEMKLKTGFTWHRETLVMLCDDVKNLLFPVNN